MKLGLKGGKGGIKALALQHGEKIGMALVAVCVALFIFKISGHERLPADKQHTVLTQKVNASSEKQKNYTVAQAKELSKEVAEGETPPFLDFVPIRTGASTDVPPDPYKLTPWDPAVVPQSKLREDPVLLTVTDIEVHGSSAIMPLLDEGTRRKRQLEERRREEDAKKAAEKLAEEARRNPEGRNRGEGGGRLGEGGIDGMVDPDHPNRRMAPTYGQMEGVAVQGDELMKVTYFATILAKVPIEDQIKLYRDALENAKGGYDPNGDRPQYLGAFLERAEVTDAGQELKWVPVTLRSGSGKRPWAGIAHKSVPDAIADWPAEMEEIADARFVHPLLTFPLPPLVGKNWGERAKLSDVPLQADVDPNEELNNAAEPEKPAVEEEDDLFGGTPQPGGVGPAGPGFGEGGFGRGGRGAGGRGFGGEEGGFGRGGFGRGGGMRGEGGGIGGFGGGGGNMGGARRNFDNTEEPFAQKPFWMFRFFDTSVEPGKRYRYRVKLALVDVNANVPRHFLDRKVSDRLPPLPTTVSANTRIKPAKPLMTEWSKSSPVVSIPMAGEVRLALATPPNDRQYNGESTAKLLVSSFDIDAEGKAIQAATEEEFRRGSVMNLTKTVEYLIGQYIDKVENFKFRTGATLVDIRSGRKLTSDMTAPAKVLVMDAGGRLSVRNDLTDIADVEQHRMIFAKPDPNDPRNQGGFGRGMRGGEF